MTPEQKAWIEATAIAAGKAHHIFPLMAACEAALESKYGKSQLAQDANNLFGLKLHKHNTYGEEILPTREFENSEWVTVSAEWEKYDTVDECFTDRMATLIRLQRMYPEYGMAIWAKTPEEYIVEVSKRWSTDPNRGLKVLAIYSEVTKET